MRTPTNERLTHDIDDAPASRASGSERRCILLGDSFAREELVRLAISPPDADGESHRKGPGAWRVDYAGSPCA
ncbi:MAG: hypothetical protein GVX90_02570 [Alphaproteobacteria bacterium]|jgi:hypothetical protein|nr:hypothetical protein [Alphaproteobacteria bacterium]